MTKQEFRQLAEKKIIILDGAMGSNLQKKGMPVGVCPEEWILNHPEELITLQKEFLEAGTDILYAPTFTANRIKLAEYGLEAKLAEINTSLLALTKEAIRRYNTECEDAGKPKRQIFAAGNLTMTGQQLYPIGTLEFEELVEIYKEQMKVLADAGADLLAVETMMSLNECRAALIAAKEITNLPIMVSLTFEGDGRTLYGTDPKTAAVVLQALGADAVGVNCSVGPDKMEEVVSLMREYLNVPLIVKPNAGLPELKDGKTVFNMGAEEFADCFRPLFDVGAGIAGGCCGTTPEHIKRLSIEAEKRQPPMISGRKIRAVTTECTTLEFDLDGRFLIVGERINPTGKKALQAQLKEGCLDMVCAMAEEQEQKGADILDINMGMNGINEKEMMIKVIHEVMSVSRLPLCIDSSHVDVIEAALRIYPGRAIINSISMEKEKFEKLIPMAKKYGAMFVLLPLSDEGLPKDLEEKKKIIRTILEAAKKVGLSEEDIIVDGLVNTVAANKTAALDAISTIRYCKEELNLATICGLSNISFGLPERQYVNTTFLSFAIANGLTMAIANPSQELLMNTAFAADLLKNKENADMRYIERAVREPMVFVPAARYEALLETEKNGKGESSKENVSKPGAREDVYELKKEKNLVYEAVLKGNRNKILELVKEELSGGIKPSVILNDMLIPAINETGALFEQKKYYLPQLIAAAQTMKTAIEYLEPMLADDGDAKSLGTVVIATVSGDIHDIGKNLVALMLKNYGFKVIDLGKDVKNEEVIRAAREHQADIIALSALMTTTMTEMKEVVRLRNEGGLSAKVMIGGAVITQSYCDEIGADGYSRDANEAVVVAKRILGY